MSENRGRLQDLKLGDGHVLHGVQRGALVVGAAGVVLCAVGAAAGPTQFFRSYLTGYLFWFGIALGSMAILMIHHIAGGAWGAVLRRMLEAATRTLPLLALLFLPLVFGLTNLYEWANPEHVAHDALLRHKQPYLNVPFFLGRAVFYFAAWNALAFFLNRWSLEQDGNPTPRVAWRLEQISRGGLVLVGLTMTFAAVDWVMSLEPHWYSTIYGLMLLTGQVLSAMAFAILVSSTLVRRGPLADVIGAEQFHDLGKFLLAFVMIWAYASFSQFLIIWAANLPEEIPWYLARLTGGWQFVGLAIVLFHFALPFVVLLSRDIKRNFRTLAVVAGLVMVLRFVDLFWLVTPAYRPAKLGLHWLDVAAVFAVGGIWIWAFLRELKSRALVAFNDPVLPEHLRK